MEALGLSHEREHRKRTDNCSRTKLLFLHARRPSIIVSGPSPLNMLVGTRGGDSYSEPEYTAWLREAGFTDIRRIKQPGPASLLIASVA